MVENVSGGGIGGGGGGGCGGGGGVDIEDGIQWRRWGGGHSMGVAAFDSGGDGLRIGDVKEKWTKVAAAVTAVDNIYVFQWRPWQ